MPDVLGHFPPKSPKLVAFLRKETCKLRHPMHLCHPVVIRHSQLGSGHTFGNFHTFDLVVARANARVDGSADGNFSARARHKGADLRHQHNHTRLPDVGAFTTHVGASNNLKIAVLPPKHYIVGNK